MSLFHRIVRIESCWAVSAQPPDYEWDCMAPYPVDDCEDCLAARCSFGRVSPNTGKKVSVLYWLIYTALYKDMTVRDAMQHLVWPLHNWVVCIRYGRFVCRIKRIFGTLTGHFRG